MFPYECKLSVLRQPTPATMSSTDFVVAILGVVSLVSIWKLSFDGSQRHLNQLPGPPRRFLIGNLDDIPKERAWIAYMNMSEQYGALVSAQRTVV